MSFMTINGYPVKTAVGGKRRPKAIGKDRRAVSGQMRRTVRATKREWGYRTIRQPAATVDVVEGLVQGLGNVWPFDGDVYSTKGLAPDGIPVYSDELATAIDGDGAAVIDDQLGSSVEYGSGAVGIWPATTNLLASAARNASDCTVFDGQGATMGFSDETVVTLDGDSVKAVALNGSGGDYISAAIDPGAGSATEKYSGSVYVRSVSGVTTFTVHLYDVTNSTSGTPVSFTVAPADGWVRAACKITIGGSDCRDLDLVVTTVGGAATFVVDRLQIENQQYATPTGWVDGSRATASFELVDIDWLMSGTAFTISFWTSGPNSSGFPYLFRLENADGSEYAARAYHQAGGTYCAYTSAASTAMATGTQGWGTRQGPHLITVVFDTKPAAGEPNISYYFDGVLLASDAGNMVAFSGMIKLYIGYDGAGGNQFNGAFDDLVLLPYAADAALVAAIHGLGRAFPALPAVELNGDAVNNHPVEVLGVVEGMDIKPYSDDGTWRSTAGSVAFKLLER